LIIWLSSYPRSGNTLFRITLNELGLGPTYSIYDDPAFKELDLERVVGHHDLPEGGLQYLENVSEPVFVKTHELPTKDNYPAIYIARDGRDAVVSYAHYLKNIQNDERPFSEILACLVSQQHKNIALWSDHVRRWHNRKGKVVIVKFEELTKDPVGEVIKALEQLDIDDANVSVGAKIPSFEELQGASGKFFRKGKTASWQSDMGRALERQFWRWNRLGMRIAGYEKLSEKPPKALTPLPEVDSSELGLVIKEMKPIMEGICMPPFVGPKEKSDFNFLMSLAKTRQPSHIFEYGTAEGNTVANLCQITDAHVTTLNALVEETSGNYRTFDLDADKVGWVYRKYGYQDRVTQIFQDSMDFVPERYRKDIDYDLVIIDACHDYEYVINDFLTIYKYVSPSGCILFHDSDQSMIGHLEGVWKACSHLSRSGFDIKQVKGTWWAYWAPADQKRQLDAEMLSVLDYGVERIREKNRLEKEREHIFKQYIQSEHKLDKIRNLPGIGLVQRFMFIVSRIRKH
jgi:predicted O-methyltransferase YrrM